MRDTMDPPERPARRLRPRDLKRKSKDIITVSNTPKKPRKTLSVDGSTELQDVYCWECHYTCVDEALDCATCPRTFHAECLPEGSTGPSAEGEPWTCSVCQAIMKAECSETRSWAMQQVKRDRLAVMLAAAVERMKSNKENAKKQIYASTDALMKDAEWIQHNSSVFNGPTSKITQDAKLVVKICKYEMSEIELCPDCYYNSTVRGDNWFVKPCTFPHCLVWAKLKGFPYWPAKALRMSKSGNVDVRFFGAHDRSWLPAGQVYLLSEEPPTGAGRPSKKLRDYDDAMKEIEQHVNFLNEVPGFSFKYAPSNTEFSASHLHSCPALFGDSAPQVTSGPRLRRLSGESVESIDVDNAAVRRNRRAARDRSAGSSGHDRSTSRPGSAGSSTSHTSSDAPPAAQLTPGGAQPPLPEAPLPAPTGGAATPVLQQEASKPTVQQDRTGLPTAPATGTPPLPMGPVVVPTPGARYARRTGKLVISKSPSLSAGTGSPILIGSAPSSAPQTPNAASVPTPILPPTQGSKPSEPLAGVFEPTSTHFVDLVSPTGSKSAVAPPPAAMQPKDGPPPSGAYYTTPSSTPDHSQPPPQVVTPETLNSLERISQSLQDADDTGSSARTTPDLPSHHVATTSSHAPPSRPISAAKKRTLDSCIQKLKSAGPSPILGGPKTNTPTPPFQPPAPTAAPHPHNIPPPHSSTPPAPNIIPPPVLHGPGPSNSNTLPSGSRSTPSLPPALHRPLGTPSDHNGGGASAPLRADKRVERATAMFMDRLAARLKPLMDGAFAETLATLSVTESGMMMGGTEYEQQVNSLKEDMKALRWMHHQSLNELRTSTRNAIAEAQSMFEADKQRIATEMKRQFDEELQKAVAEAKMKQWCANCGKEAVFYCCWNTSYCDYPCQQAHWPKHMESCGQIRSDGASAGSQPAQPLQRPFAPPHVGPPPSIPQKPGFGSPHGGPPSAQFPQPPPYRKPPQFNPPPTSGAQSLQQRIYGSGGHLGLGMRRL